MSGLKSIICDPDCGFMMRSHEEKEVMDLTMQHVKHAHKEMKVSKDDLKKMAKNPILNSPVGSSFSAMLKLAIQTREEMRRESIFTLERYQGHLRGWTLFAIAQGIINSGGKVPRII